MKRIAIFAVMFIICFVKGTNAQCPEYTPEPPTLIDTKVLGSAVLDKNTEIYTYSYILKSGKDSTGCIWWFAVDITYPKDSITLPTDGLVDYPKYVDKGVLTDPDTAKMLPVAFPKVLKISNYTGAWDAGLTMDGEAVWGASDPLGDNRFLLPPGKELQGFIMTTYGLPTIRSFKIEPRFDPPPFEEGEDTPEKVEELLKTRESLVWKGKTIGPTAPPADFKPVDFLSNIINMKHEAYKLGWIKNEGILKSLDVKLESAKKDIEKGNTRSAKNTIKAFINEVEAQGCESYDNCPSGKHLTSEAYGLLKYNALYLIDRL